MRSDLLFAGQLGCLAGSFPYQPVKRRMPPDSLGGRYPRWHQMNVRKAFIAAFEAHAAIPMRRIVESNRREAPN